MAMHFINRNRVSNLVEFYIREQRENHTGQISSAKARSCFQRIQFGDKEEHIEAACGRTRVDEASEEQMQSESNITHTSQQSSPGRGNSPDGHCATSVRSGDADVASLEEELLCRGASDLLLLRMASPPETEAHGDESSVKAPVMAAKPLDLNVEPVSPVISPTPTFSEFSEEVSVQLSVQASRSVKSFKESDRHAVDSDAAETRQKRKRPAQQPTKTCPKCGKHFSTGQALGGHMRKHWNGPVRVQTKQLLAEDSPAHSHESDLESPQHEAKQRRIVEAESTERLLAVADIDLNLRI